MLPNGEFSPKNIYSVSKKSNNSYGELVDLIKKIESDQKSSSNLIFVTDNDNNFLYANNAFLKLYQYTVGEILNIEFNQIFVSPNSPLIINGSSDTANQFPISKQVLSLKKDNSVVEININILPVYDANGFVCGYQNTISHYEENLSTEEELTKLFKELRHSFKNFPDTE